MRSNWIPYVGALYSDALGLERKRPPTTATKPWRSSKGNQLGTAISNASVNTALLKGLVDGSPRHPWVGANTNGLVSILIELTPWNNDGDCFGLNFGQLLLGHVWCCEGRAYSRNIRPMLTDNKTDFHKTSKKFCCKFCENPSLL